MVWHGTQCYEAQTMCVSDVWAMTSRPKPKLPQYVNTIIFIHCSINTHPFTCTWLFFWNEVCVALTFNSCQRPHHLAINTHPFSSLSQNALPWGLIVITCCQLVHLQKHIQWFSIKYELFAIENEFLWKKMVKPSNRNCPWSEQKWNGPIICLASWWWLQK